MAIAYKSAGAGASTETSGAALSPTCPATVDAGDILIGHVFWEETTTAPSTPSGWTLLAGPYVIQLTIARHWVFGRIADGTENGASVAFGSPAVTTQRGARIYSFSGRVSGGVVQIVNGFAHTSNSNDPTAPNVTTTRAGALAVLLVGQNDNNAFSSFTGETGGNWTEAVAEYTAGLTPGLALGIQTCTPTNDPGTVTGGSDNTLNDPAGVIGFQILDQDPQTATATGLASATVTVVRVAAPAVEYTLTANVAGLTSATASRSVVRSLGGVASTSTSTANANETTRRVLGTLSVAGTSAATATIIRVAATQTLRAAPAGVSTATVTLYRVIQIQTDAVAGTSTATVSLQQVMPRDVSVAATSTATATLFRESPPPTTFVASPAGLSATSVTLFRVVRFSIDAVAGTSTATVSLHHQRSVLASVASTSSATVFIQTVQAAATTVASTSTVSLAIMVRRSLSAAVGNVSSSGVGPAFGRAFAVVAACTAVTTADLATASRSVVGKYAVEHAAAYAVVQTAKERDFSAEHAAAYAVVRAAEEGDFSAIHTQAFADVFKAGF